MTSAGSKSLTRAVSRMRPLTKSNGTVTVFVTVWSVETLATGTSPLTLSTTRHVNNASHGQRTDGSLAMTRSLAESSAIVTWNARAPGFGPIGRFALRVAGASMLDPPQFPQ